MPAVIDTVRFLEWGKPSPAGSRFQGTITAKSVFGSDGWLDYTGRESATEEKTETEIECREDGFLGYGSREDAAEGSTMSSIGILTAERKAEFRKMCTDSFCEDGDLIWDVVISLDSYQLAQKNGLEYPGRLRRRHCKDSAGILQKCWTESGQHVLVGELS
jgi:hypothetical protein